MGTGGLGHGSRAGHFGSFYAVKGQKMLRVVWQGECVLRLCLCPDGCRPVCLRAWG